jgi:NAD(P)-dependent dehydrogenase (short-subunit alcohol dehydrogenase family)
MPELLRAGLLAGVSIVVAGVQVRGSAAAPQEGSAGAPADGSAGATLVVAVAAACADLGARVLELELDGAATAGQQDDALEDAADRALAQADGVAHMLVIDAASVFAAAAAAAAAGPGSGGQRYDVQRAALRACLDASWNATRALAVRAFLVGGRGGRVVLLAPAPDAGGCADAARAGLENLARTLSIEWARHAVTVVAIAPASAASAAAGVCGAPAEVAALVAYLASPAGAYFSGCLLDLTGPRAGLSGAAV